MGKTVWLVRNGKYWKLVWVDRLGARRSRSIGTLGQREAQAMRLQKMAEIQAKPEATDLQDITLGVWLARFEERIQAMSPHTRRMYTPAIARLKSHFGAAAVLRRINRDDAQGFADAVRAEMKGRSENTIRGVLGRAKRIMQAAVEVDYLQINPFDRVKTSIKRTDKTVPYIDRKQFARILDHARDDEYRLFLALMRWAGLRFNEATRVEWSWIDWKRCTMQVRPMPRDGAEMITTKQGFRVVPIRPELMRMLLSAHEQSGKDSTGPCQRITYTVARRQTANAYEGAGIAIEGDMHHALRASCEMDWLEKHPFFDVAKWLGHHPAVAFSHYHRVRRGEMDKVSGVSKPVSKRKVSSKKTP